MAPCGSDKRVGKEYFSFNYGSYIHRDFASIKSHGKLSPIYFFAGDYGIHFDASRHIAGITSMQRNIHIRSISNV